MSKIAWALLATLIVGCGDMKRPDEVPKPDGMQSPGEFQSGIKSYPYEMSRERKDRIINNYGKLQVGMSKAEIARLIGDPDCSSNSYGPKGPGERWLGSSWDYHFRFVSDRDSGRPRLTIFFGKDDRAEWIVPDAIPGLSEKGGFRSSGDRPAEKN